MKFWSIIKGIFWAIIIIGSILLLMTAISPFGYRSFVVRSGSMEPKIKTGSLVVTQKRAEYQVGNIVTFKTTGSDTVTHRIAAIETENGTKIIKTKGDANDSIDNGSINENQIVGAVLFSIPLVGYGINFIKTLPGLLIFIIFPAIIIISDEVIKIRDEAANISKKKKNVEPERTILKGIILALFATCFVVGSTSAYFSDMKSIKGNEFTIGTWDVVVINEVYYQNGDEWIELYNPGNEMVDIKGWSICNESGDCGKLNPSKKTELKPKGYVLVAHDADVMKGWNVAPGTPEIYYAGGKIVFKDTGDSVVLKNSSNVEVDAMSYGSSTYAFDPSCELVPSLKTLERSPAGHDTNSADDFKVPVRPTPGTY